MVDSLTLKGQYHYSGASERVIRECADEIPKRERGGSTPGMMSQRQHYVSTSTLAFARTAHTASNREENKLSNDTWVDIRGLLIASGIQVPSTLPSTVAQLTYLHHCHITKMNGPVRDGAARSASPGGAATPNLTLRSRGAGTRWYFTFRAAPKSWKGAKATRLDSTDSRVGAALQKAGYEGPLNFSTPSEFEAVSDAVCDAIRQAYGVSVLWDAEDCQLPKSRRISSDSGVPTAVRIGPTPPFVLYHEKRLTRSVSAPHLDTPISGAPRQSGQMMPISTPPQATSTATTQIRSWVLQ
eukprot:m.429683 g.429683  ORF g.429683 m.429683 type:complete len:298 (-) comp17050_c0_seq1:1776-2669(-)